ncbi:T9SS type A sorting domain-containing protein [Flavitalea sp. BT771]|uniref:T9SS type A sorting domain-containing protein n=1 Tax=Flavitalea sp. BT771 TaxID=3063329 RepID=UPI0026E3FCF3|nr:T9SS type A sorting domain-containing protein [Flavitalea sp. BT771]MDO6429148.1 T9SS type A sorting domain-containing protein [Flavitalea sp. BT771]MDV6218724.1 T9SS type A sorting domain-containing protein [Flavitalea sp. BT771]
MSKTSTLQKTCRLLTGVAAIGLSLTILQPANASPLPAGMHSLSKGTFDTVHSIQVNKSLISKKNKIRLFPDAKQQVLFFSANGEDKRVYQLYLFDMDGRLVNQASIRNRETTVLTTLCEGNYLFEVFTDDERIENGHLVVR